MTAALLAATGAVWAPRPCRRRRVRWLEAATEIGAVAVVVDVVLMWIFT